MSFVRYAFAIVKRSFSFKQGYHYPVVPLVCEIKLKEFSPYNQEGETYIHGIPSGASRSRVDRVLDFHAMRMRIKDP